VIATAQAEGPAVGTQVIATAQGKDLQKTQWLPQHEVKGLQ
jgi:hypothetical protein